MHLFRGIQGVQGIGAHHRQGWHQNERRQGTRHSQDHYNRESKHAAEPPDVLQDVIPIRAAEGHQPPV